MASYGSFLALGGMVGDELQRLGGRVLGATPDVHEAIATFDWEADGPTLAALGAEVVVADLAVVTMDRVHALREDGLRVETVDSSSIKRTAGTIRQLGTFVDNRPAAIAIANEIEGQLNDWLDRLAHTNRPVVLPLSWPEPVTGAGPATVIHDVLWTAGLANALSGMDDPWPELSVEMMYGADVVLGLPFFADWEAFAHLGAMGDAEVLIPVPAAALASGRHVMDAVRAMGRTVRQIHQLLQATM